MNNMFYENKINFYKQKINYYNLTKKNNIKINKYLNKINILDLSNNQKAGMPGMSTESNIFSSKTILLNTEYILPTSSFTYYSISEKFMNKISLKQILHSYNDVFSIDLYLYFNGCCLISLK